MKSVFKSPALRDRILDRYNAILSAFPFEKRFVETRFGRTFALEAGSAGNPALILLHGSCSNSAFWFPELCALSERFRVLALDIPGEAGNSADNRLDLRTEDYADWLLDALDGFGIGRASVAGNSLGGWMALRFATKYPERVEKLALIAPGGLSDVHAAVFARASRAEAEGETLTIDSTLTGGAELPAPVLEFMNLILSGFNPIAEGLPLFSDGQLERLDMPVLFVGGTDDDMLDMPTAAKRIGALPAAEVILLEGAGHIISNAVEYLAPFLGNGLAG